MTSEDLRVMEELSTGTRPLKQKKQRKPAPPLRTSLGDLLKDAGVVPSRKQRGEKVEDC